MGGVRPNLVLAQVQVFGPLVLGPFGPDLGPNLDLTWDLDLDLSLTIIGGESINMKHSRWGIEYIWKKCDLDKNLDGAGIMYLRV